MSEMQELLITKASYREFLCQRLRLQGTAAQQEIENIGFSFLFASGSEMLRSYILQETSFLSDLADEYKIPDRGFMWYLFSQAVREIHVTPDQAVIKYQLQDCYRKPFKQFYL
jgi:hypothetical protein